MFVKSTAGVNFINVLRTIFFVRMSFRQLFSSYMYVEKRRLYEKFVHLTLMKSSSGHPRKCAASHRLRPTGVDSTIKLSRQFLLFLDEEMHFFFVFLNNFSFFCTSKLHFFRYDRPVSY